MRQAKLLVAASVVTLAACATAAKSQTSGEALSWLEGCWQTESGGTREVWSSAEGGFRFGYNVSLRDGEVGFFEHLRIEPTGDGLNYVAMPRGRDGVVFSEVGRSQQSISFAKPDHDFPQLIVYSRDGKTLSAVISLSDGSKARTWWYGPCPR